MSAQVLGISASQYHESHPPPQFLYFLDIYLHLRAFAKINFYYCCFKVEALYLVYQVLGFFIHIVLLFSKERKGIQDILNTVGAGTVKLIFLEYIYF